jgi:hypothetical protein
LGAVLFDVDTNGLESVVDRLSGSSAFCVTILKFASGAEKSGRWGGGFADKDRFEGGNSREGEEIGLESNPTA